MRCDQMPVNKTRDEITEIEELEDALAKANTQIEILCENLLSAAKFAPDGLKQGYEQYVKEIKDK